MEIDHEAETDRSGFKCDIRCYNGEKQKGLTKEHSVFLELIQSF